MTNAAPRKRTCTVAGRCAREEGCNTLGHIRSTRGQTPKEPGSDPMFSSRNAHAVVLATFATQMVIAMSNSTLPTIAPKLAEALQIQPALIGYQVSLLFGAAVVGTLYGGSYTRRYGACRT